MAIVPRKLRSGKTVYWVTFEWNGSTKWERSGGNEREAQALEALRWREAKDGTYTPEVKGRVTVKAWFNYYWTKRKNRTLDNDIALIDNHVLSVEWFGNMPLHSVRPPHILRLIEEIEGRKNDDGTRRLGAKSVAIVYGIMKGAFARAVFDEKVATNPCALPKGRIKWKSSKGNARRPYTREEAYKLVHDHRVRLESRVWNALAFYTGMREGEICGRLVSDWQRDALPLSALSVHTQYNGQPLKTDDDEDIHPRMVPVHPELETILRDWLAEGFELVHRRKPEPHDFLVPNRQGGNHTKSSAYKMFREAQRKVEVQNRTLHSTRHTFISNARSNGARGEVVERVTHNASGAIIDTYTTFEWRPLCEAVVRFDLNLDPKASEALFTAPKPGLEAGRTAGKQAKAYETSKERRTSQVAGNTEEDPDTDAIFDASQRKALKLAEADPEAALPALSIGRGLAAAKRGELSRVEAELLTAAEALGLTGTDEVSK